MAMVTLNQVWIHDAADLSVHVRLKARNIRGTPEREGRFEEATQGRIRIVTTKTRRHVVRFDALRVSRDDLAQLEEWQGELLMYRDPRGRKLFGTFMRLPVSERIHTELGDVSGFEFTATTADEAV